jgi:hypothetical protein
MSDERRARQAQKKLAEATPSIVRRSVLVLRKQWKRLLWCLGAPSLLDILKEFVRGKLVDQTYIHLGSIERWLLAYPLAFFTLGLSPVIATIVGATIKESRKPEDSEIFNEQGIPYERQPVSPKWTRGLALVGIACVSIISYGTYRYYQISVGHFKVDGGYNIILPVPPGVPMPAPTKPPSSLLDVFNDDFPTLFKARNDLSIEGTNTRLKEQVYLDFLGKADFVGFYIPASSNPISDNNTPKVCVMLIDQVPTFLAKLSKETPMWAGYGSQGNTLDELTFTGRVLIYHEDLLSITQEADIINAYKLKNLDIQFRSEDYLMGRIAMWRQQHP